MSASASVGRSVGGRQTFIFPLGARCPPRSCVNHHGLGFRVRGLGLQRSGSRVPENVSLRCLCAPPAQPKFSVHTTFQAHVAYTLLGENSNSERSNRDDTKHNTVDDLSKTNKSKWHQQYDSNVRTCNGL